MSESEKTKRIAEIPVCWLCGLPITQGYAQPVKVKGRREYRHKGSCLIGFDNDHRADSLNNLERMSLIAIISLAHEGRRIKPDLVEYITLHNKTLGEYIKKQNSGAP